MELMARSKMKMRTRIASAVFAVAWAAFGAAVYEHGIFDSVSLDGEWEMAYQP